jgi:ABC-2 type transport system permease protein
MKKEKTNANQTEKTSLVKRLSKGSSRRGTYAAAVSAVVIAIVVFLNLIIGQLPSNVLEFDISDNNLYDISYTSEQLLSALDTDVKITVLAESGNADERILKFLDDYAALSPHVTVTTIDPVLYPSVLEKYDTVENTVVVENEDSGNYTVIDLYGFDGYGDAMLLYDYSYYSYYGSYYETSFDAEGLLTSAVSYVTNETSSLVYTLEGHGESSFGASVTELFTKNHIDTDSVDLLMDGGVPEDCELLICYNPTEDLADDELTILQSIWKTAETSCC